MANLVETNRWEAGIYQLETSDPVMGGPNGIDNRPTRELANRTLWLKTELAKAVASIGQNKTAADQGLATKADKTVRIIAGNGLTGGNTLEQNITVTLGLPSKITGSTTNSVSATSHTHEIDNASTTTPGVVKLNDTLSSLSTSEALTANQGRMLNNNKADKAATLAGYGITDFAVANLGTDSINDLLKVGIYGQALNVQATPERGYPVAQAGTLIVGLSAYGCQQIYLPFMNHEIYSRRRTHEGTWSDWTVRAVIPTRRITAGSGLTGGGDLLGDRTISLGNPGKITASTTNSVSATSHTHEIDNASTTTPGVVKLNDTLSSLSTSEALTANQGRELNNNKADKTAIKFSRPIVSAGSVAITLDVNSRSGIVAALGDNFIGWGYNQLVLHNNESSNITGLPITGNHPIQLDIQVMGGYSLMYCHYLFLGRVFFSRINWNNEVLGVNWIELYTSKQMPAANTDTAGIVQLSNSLTDTATNKALSAAMGKKLADDKMANTGAQTLNGTLTINGSGWGRLYMPTNDGGSWRLEVNPAGDADKRFNFVFTRPNNGGSVYIHYPAITKTESVAYQSYVDNKNNLKTVDYATDQSSGHVESGFYRSNNHQINGHALPNLDIHINHPTAAGLAYARGIGFSYGGTWGVYTTSYNKDGQYLGTKKILTEDDAVPAGTVCYMAGAAAPAGWLKANGAAVSRTTYSALFAAIGTRYGAGNGSSTFNLPDLRGEFIRGWDDGRGIDAGRALGSTQAESLISHNHNMYYRSGGESSGGVSDDSGFLVMQSDVDLGYRYNPNVVQPTGGAETRPRNISLLAIIKI